MGNFKRNEALMIVKDYFLLIDELKSDPTMKEVIKLYKKHEDGYRFYKFDVIDEEVFLVYSNGVDKINIPFDLYFLNLK